MIGAPLSIRGLLHEDSTIQELDLRGNGLTKDDVTLGQGGAGTLWYGQ